MTGGVNWGTFAAYELDGGCEFVRHTNTKKRDRRQGFCGIGKYRGQGSDPRTSSTKNPNLDGRCSVSPPMHVLSHHRFRQPSRILELTGFIFATAIPHAFPSPDNPLHLDHQLRRSCFSCATTQAPPPRPPPCLPAAGAAKTMLRRLGGPLDWIVTRATS
jgi:hypothetical protein